VGGVHRALLSACLTVLCVAQLWLWPTASSANERHFAYAYETGVLPHGAVELELWSTARVGRDDYYTRFDQRLELEVGLGHGLQTAFYMNFRAIAEETSDDIKKRFDFRGVSSEWKLKLSDPTADALGSAVYAEITWMPHEVELEAKLLLDKRLGDFLVAYNLVGELEIEIEKSAGAEAEWEKKIIVENLLSFGFFASERTSVGVELRSPMVWKDGSLSYAALFAGPSVSFSDRSWWVAMSVLAQLPALKGSEGSPDEVFVLDSQERFEARLLLGFHL
jgi:hypothetical protein